MGIRGALDNAGHWVKKNSPYILFGLGVVGFGATVAAAIKATADASDIIDDMEDGIDNVREYYHIDPEVEDKDIDIEEAVDEIKEIKRTAHKEIAKEYILTGVLGAGTLVCFGGSFSIINKRYAGAALTLAATTEVFDKYRERVREEENGAIKDYAYMNGLDIEEVEETVEDPETGKKKKVKKTVLKGEPKSLFAYRFEQYDIEHDTGSTQWQSSSVFTLPYIHGVIQHRQRQLEIGKRVWLSDVLDDLGFGQNSLTGVERYAGWAPGDIILCGLEEIGDSTIDPMSEDALNYIYGNASDVTLIFNPRCNLYEEVYGKKKEVTV